MAVKKKAKPVAKKTKPAKKSKAAERAKKALAKKPRITRTRIDYPPSEAMAGTDKGLVPIADSQIVEQWSIVHVVVDNLEVFGIANDQRVYRWNTRAALWVLHKEGLTA